MWPNGEGPSSMGNGRASTGSEVMIVNDMVAAAANEVPSIASMNIHRSPGTHIGHKFVTVSQTVHNNDVIKGRLLGLELVSPAHNKRLRCCVAVFVCWALVVASGLAIYFFYFTLYKEQTRHNLDLSTKQYLWDLVKNSTRAERISCSAAVFLVLLCAILLVIYFTIIAKIITPEPDEAPHEWRISRDNWLAEPYNNTPLEAQFEPVRLVIIQHSVSAECHRFAKCATELRILQDYFIKKKDRDIPYNFIIGNDGRVYDGRGWNKEGAHTLGYNLCSIGIGFIGDYREEKGTYTKVTEAQQNRTHLLLKEGVQLGYLHPKYFVVGAKDLRPSESPGSNLYAAIQNWPHYDHENRFKNKTCDEINVMPI